MDKSLLVAESDQRPKRSNVLRGSPRRLASPKRDYGNVWFSSNHRFWMGQWVGAYCERLRFDGSQSEVHVTPAGDLARKSGQDDANRRIYRNTTGARPQRVQ